MGGVPPSMMSLDLFCLFLLLAKYQANHAHIVSVVNTCPSPSYTHLVTTKLLAAAITVALIVTLGSIRVTGGFILKDTNWNNFEKPRVIFSRIFQNSTILIMLKEARGLWADARLPPTLIERRMQRRHREASATPTSVINIRC